MMWRSRQRGQILVLFTGAVVALILASGLVVDGGFAYAEERNTQNGADSAAKAGALILARQAAGATCPVGTGTPPNCWDEPVRNAVFGSAGANLVAVNRAIYTDWQGVRLPAGCDSAADASTWSCAMVGGGVVPTDAAGVWVEARKNPGTFLVRLAGISQWNILQDATAVSGPTTACEGTASDACILLPVTFPVTVLQCGQGNTSVPADPPQAWSFGQPITLPLCGGNPGSVGWIDWTPPNGGSSELEQVINNPPPVNIPLPSWQYITATGDISSSQVENALNQYAGQIVQVPMFDSTCNTTPTDNSLSGCPAGSVGGNGTNQWYHIKKFLAFELASPKGAFINGSYLHTDCASVNSDSCIKGAFVDFITEGTVTGPCPGTCPEGTEFAVQLIK
jgi:hypothetical protein